MRFDKLNLNRQWIAAQRNFSKISTCFSAQSTILWDMWTRSRPRHHQNQFLGASTQFWTGSIRMHGSGQSLLTILKHSHGYVMGCRWSRLICTLILLHTLGMSSQVEAQHCGRIGYMPEWNQSLMSWEGTGSVSAVGTTVDLWRLKGQSCDGPLCRSQVPVPLAPHDSGSGLDSLLPWRCTAFVAACQMDPFIGRLLMGQELAPLDPALDRLFKPPRSI